MADQSTKYIGFTCAYTPLALIHAAGYVPYRILPLGDSPEGAGQVLNDNLCPHVKRLLDRAMDRDCDLPNLEGVVFVASCDAMRRLTDAWPRVRPQDRTTMIDLPVAADDSSVTFLAGELSRLTETLAEWGGRKANDADIRESIGLHNSLSGLLESVRGKNYRGALDGGASKLQDLYNKASTWPVQDAIKLVETISNQPDISNVTTNGVPVYLFGNVLPDPSALSLFESCGVRIVGEDLCTGSRVFQPLKVDGPEDPLRQLAAGILSGNRCARTLDASQPGTIAEEVVARTEACNARGVIAHAVKFCDPYFARLPLIRDGLREAGLPLLTIEGDCSMGSFGQQKTRIEAFAEMLR
jgi:benzoyl-CoA reductase/2-hydroxyglutaryl-CoA dehydratase subunit BcrC/BadD/HgdB